uniref:Type II secretion system core protein G n=1 Tax=Candidatus Kentrum sp. DK TaxID=2126562 RepID=A0A450T344_9GAMM|nr:MAG: general secretion pathway protein G [Candidatus Kentron sp. DK]VFJ60971.1 MAG: general secretion pathway protein G [Candidatus Kentron sp. DK]
MNERTSKRNAGFTLIEVMVVVVILAILASIVVPRIMDRPDAARLTKAKQDIRAIESALSLYRLDNFRYPDTDQGLEALLPGRGGNGTVRKIDGYLSRLPRDPWGNPYHYLRPGEHGQIDIYTLGADGQPGGSGNDADIGNWDL